MLRNLKEFIKKKLFLLAKKNKEPIIVFESDDWGSVRNSNKNSLELIKNNYNLQLDNYQSFDCLETYEDITSLIEILSGFQNNEKQFPKFTLNYVLNNPKFNYNKTIEEESVVETYNRDLERKDILEIVKTNNLLKPQYHSFEHFNYAKYQDELKVESLDKFAFDNGCIGLNPCKYSNLDACNTNFGNLKDVEEKLNKGLKQFKDIFGYYSKSIIFPCYVWQDSLEKICKFNGVKYLQGKIYQNVPNGSKYKRKFNSMGKKSRSGLIYLTRNVDFEPSKAFLNKVDAEDYVNNTIKEIEFLIDKKVPVVICTHRVNYVSGIDKLNRDYGLKCLKILLTKILEKYPNIKFLTSDELGDLYEN